MFLYWKKRGTYELEAPPASLAEERYSWASSLDVSPNLCGKRMSWLSSLAAARTHLRFCHFRPNLLITLS